MSTDTARRAAPWLLPILLLLVAGSLRFYKLGYPDRIYFDETYYANDANQYLLRGVEEGFAVHPPVGKWLIAGGIEVFGFDSFGYRAAAAAVGTATVGVTYLAALRLFRRRGTAALTALLVAVDGLAFTMSRIAMLDIFLACFVTLGFWLLLVDRDRMWQGAPAAGEPPPAEPRYLPHRPHAYRWLAGIAFGLALATKWSAVLAILCAGVFVAVSEVAWRRRMTGSLYARPERIVLSGLLTLVVVPLVVYVASYAGWFANFSETRLGKDVTLSGPVQERTFSMIETWWHDQRDIGNFHKDLDAEHPYRSPADGWALMARPVAYYYENCTPEREPDNPCVTSAENVEEILGVGNPAIWWPALGAYLYLLWGLVYHRDWQAGAILLFLLGQYLPWLASPRPAFFFYATPIVPFIALALTYTGWRLQRRPELRWIPAVIATAAVAGFLFWYPLFVGLEIPRSAWDLRIISNRWI